MNVLDVAFGFHPRCCAYGVGVGLIRLCNKVYGLGFIMQSKGQGCFGVVKGCKESMMYGDI